jgi:hypothetical protein
MKTQRRVNVRVRAAMCAFAMWLAAAPAAAQTQDEQPVAAAQPTGVHMEVADTLKFLAGGGLGLVMHEGGHLFFDVAFDANPYVERIHFGPFPFFAVTHRTGLSPRREFTISSAGFWVQSATSEWILTAHPDVRHEHAPLLKGVLAFNVLNSVGYAFVALAKAGPAERDTRGMADSIGVSERTIALVVAAPAVLDAWRYLDPESRAAKWSSRLAKAGTVLLVLKRTSSSPR